MWPSTIFEGRLRSSQTVLVEGVDRWSKAQYPVCEGVSRVTRRLEPARNTWANFWISTRISVGSPGRSGRTAASVKSPQGRKAVERWPSSARMEARVLSVHHWTDRLFSFTTTRDTALRFSNGHFTMIGLKVDGKNLLRAYSIASPNYEEHLEFLSIKVPDGPLTSRLQNIQVGDTILVGKKPTGTLLIDYL